MNSRIANAGFLLKQSDAVHKDKLVEILGEQSEAQYHKDMNRVKRHILGGYGLCGLPIYDSNLFTGWWTGYPNDIIKDAFLIARGEAYVSEQELLVEQLSDPIRKAERKAVLNYLRFTNAQVTERYVIDDLLEIVLPLMTFHEESQLVVTRHTLLP